MGKYERRMEKGSRSTEADRHNAANNGGGGNGGGRGAGALNQGCVVAVLAAVTAVARVKGWLT